MHVLLTRPEQQGQHTAGLLRARGHLVSHAPMLRIEPISDFDVGGGPFAALAITSTNAIYAVAQHRQKQELLDLPLFVVGERTAEAARGAGFRNVVSADGDVMRLAEVAVAKIPPGKSVLYLAGEDRTGDLEGLLAATGRRVRVAVAYRAVAETGLQNEVSGALKADSIDAVMHFSRRTAAIFLHLAAVSSCLVNILKCKHFCLSSQVTELLAEAGATRIFVAKRPDEAAMLDLVDTT